MIFEILFPFVKSIKYKYFTKEYTRSTSDYIVNSAFGTLKNLEHLSVDNYVTYHDSLNNYCLNERPSLKRMQMFVLYWISTWLACLYFAILTQYYDDTSMKSVGFPLILSMEARKLVFSAILLGAIIVVIVKSVVLYYEHKKKLYFFNVFNCWIKDQSFGLKPDKTYKLAIHINLLFGAMFVTFKIFIPVCSIIIIFNSIIAYVYYDYSIAKLALHDIFFYLLIKNVLNAVCVLVCCFYITITYLNYKFDEVLQSLRMSILWNNTGSIMAAIAEHHSTTCLVHQLSYSYNIIIGTVYLIVPYILVILLKLRFIQDLPVYIRALIMITFVITLTLMHLFNILCASVTTRNKRAPEKLYRLYCSYKFISLFYRLKIMAMLEKLTGDFAGFYCLYLFRFTKSAYYKYFIGIITAYILLSKLDADLENYASVTTNGFVLRTLSFELL